MLRTVKSLPSLRLLYQQEIKCVVNTTAHFQQTRNVHQTTKKETILLDQSANKSKYTTMNLQGLKMECKKRGLKVSGRKLDLIQRLSSQDEGTIENARSYSKAMTNKLEYSKDIPPVLKDFKLKESQDSTGLKMKIKLTEKKGDLISKIKTQKEDQMSELKEKIKEQKFYELKDKKELEKRKQLELLKQNEVRKQLEQKKQEDQKRLQEQKRQAELQKQIEIQKQIEFQKQVELQKQTELKKLQEKQDVLKNVVRSAVLSSVKEKAAAHALKKAQQESKLKIIQDARDNLQNRAKVQKKEQQQKQQNEQNSQPDDNLTKRDVAFLTVFSASTIGWWSLKN